MPISNIPEISSIKIGNTSYGPKAYSDILGNICRLVLLEENDEARTLSRAGSATLIQYNNKKYIVTAKHTFGKNIQVEDIPLEKICVIGSNPNTLVNIPICACLYETENPDQEFHDILIFVVSSPWANETQEAPYFIPLRTFAQERQLSHFVGTPVNDTIVLPPVS